MAEAPAPRPAPEPIQTRLREEASAPSLLPNAVTHPTPETLASAPDLEALKACTQGCLACPLGAGRIRFVFGEGAPAARMMFVGEGPGRDEDLQGRPFVGKAGELLDKMIAAIGYRRNEVYICLLYTSDAADE